MSSSYVIGIDTGGTYTDAVIMAVKSGRVVASAKRPTTPHKLSKGMIEAVKAVLDAGRVAPGDIDLVGVSTTLATNAVVQNRGARVGLFIIGYKKPVSVPVVGSVFIQGGHEYNGVETAPLAVEGIVDAVAEFKGRVDAYAVCSSMSFRNPAHELVAAKAINMVDPKPVFCAHQSSNRSGVQERAATAVFHAQLLPLMQEFLDDIRSALQDFGVNARMAVVRGDAQAMDIAQTMEEPASTFAAGPAASACFGADATTAQDVLVVDVGGTTTDVMRVTNGAPVLREGGSMIGKWETHLRAIEMRTSGVGGDSFISTTSHGLSVGPSRVLPLSACTILPDPEQWLDQHSTARCILPAPGLAAEAVDGDPVLEALAQDGATPFKELMGKTGKSEFALNGALDVLLRRRQVLEAGFTPTDALHVLGQVDFGNAELAQAGARALARALDMDVQDICREVVKIAQGAIEDTILRHLLYSEAGHGASGLIDIRRKFTALNAAFTINLPIVGLGAAAPQLLAGVAEKLGAELITPEHYDVGNAVGAVLMALKMPGAEQ